MKKAKSISPLLSIGTFGTHLITTPAGTWSFAGTVPSELMNTRYTSQAEGITAFVEWFTSQPATWQDKKLRDLREDVRAAVRAAVRESLTK